MSGEDEPSGSAGPRRWLPRQGQVLRVLTATQNVSAMVFSVFLGVHIASPIAASVGGSQLADKTMMIARDYYLPLEPLLVYTPLAVHLFSGAIRRAIITYKTSRPPPLQPHIITGWLLPFFLFPHIGSHRLVPSSSTPPISSMSPSELSFEYVGWGIRKWPFWSIVSYGGLVLTALWHSGIGTMKIVSWMKGMPSRAPGQPGRSKITGKRKLGLRGILAGFLVVIGVGLARIASEADSVSSVMVKRYEAVYRAIPWSALYSI